MKALQEKILKDGRVADGNILKVDNFLNHQLDIAFLNEIGKEFKERFKDEKIDKILTIEASGIAIASIASQHFGNVPVVFAKKNRSSNLPDHVYTSQVQSFTHGTTSCIVVSKDFLKPDDRVLIIDDFLANGCALEGLAEIIQESGATLVGAGIVIEKAYQRGGQALRAKGIRVESLARIQEMSPEKGVVFA